MTTFGNKQVGEFLYVKDLQLGCVYVVKISHISVYGNDLDISYTSYKCHHNNTVRVNKNETEHPFKTCRYEKKSRRCYYKNYIISCKYVDSEG